LHTELALDLAERIAVRGQQRLALVGELGEEGGAQIFRGCPRELGLAFHLGLAGQHQVGQRQVEIDPAQGGIERGARHAHRLRFRP